VVDADEPLRVRFSPRGIKRRPLSARASEKPALVRALFDHRDTSRTIQRLRATLGPFPLDFLADSNDLEADPAASPSVLRLRVWSGPVAGSRTELDAASTLRIATRPQHWRWADPLVRDELQGSPRPGNQRRGVGATQGGAEILDVRFARRSATRACSPRNWRPQSCSIGADIACPQPPRPATNLPGRFDPGCISPNGKIRPSPCGPRQAFRTRPWPHCPKGSWWGGQQLPAPLAPNSVTTFPIVCSRMCVQCHHPVEKLPMRPSTTGLSLRGGPGRLG